MKIPVERIALDELGYEGEWVEMPRTLRLKEVTARRKVHPPDPPEDELEVSKPARNAPDDEQKRYREAVEQWKTQWKVDDGNIRMLSRVRAWSLTDDDGNPLPTVSSAEGNREKQLEIVGEVPIDVLVFVTNKLVGNLQATAQGVKVVDFSKAP